MEPEENITYTNCEDVMPHAEHELGENYICIGKQYGPPPVRADYWPD